MRAIRIAALLIIAAGLLLTVGQAEAEWKYTDSKGKTRTVTLKADVPAEYRGTAEYVDLADRHRAPGAVAPAPVVAPAAVAPVGPIAPGTKWWTLPEGSPERAAAKQAAEQEAAQLRNRATQAGVGATTEGAAEFNRVSGICRGSLEVLLRPDGTLNTLGSASDRFRYEKCMQQQGYPVIWEKK
jgi:hypothetical protein